MNQRKNERPEFEKSESFACIVKRLGSPESTILLHSPCEVFRTSQIDGVIGYHQIGNCAVVIGDPICLPQNVTKLTEAFHLHCEASQLKTLYLLTHQDFAHWAIDNGCHTLIQAGAELSINPTHFQKEHNVRKKVNRSIHEGVFIKEYKNSDSGLENQIKTTIETWLQQRRGPQIHIGHIDFKNDVKKRIFYAEHKGKIVGVLMLIPVDRFQGWTVSFDIAILGAPIGTTEHLMCSMFNSLADENCHFVCLGAVSGDKLGKMVGLGLFGKTVAHLIFKTVRLVFKLDAKATYLNKYRPNFRSTFLLCRGKLSITELLALKRVLNLKL